jgi:hypothetical protein
MFVVEMYWLTEHFDRGTASICGRYGEPVLHWQRKGAGPSVKKVVVGNLGE